MMPVNLKMTCKKCKVELVRGLAILNTDTMYNDPNVRVEYTFLPENKHAKFDECWKCPKCGYSETVTI